MKDENPTKRLGDRKNLTSVSPTIDQMKGSMSSSSCKYASFLESKYASLNK